MDTASSARLLFISVRTPVQPVVCISQHFCTFSTQIIRPMHVPAIQSRHKFHHPFFLADPAHTSIICLYATYAPPDGKGTQKPGAGQIKMASETSDIWQIGRYMLSSRHYGKDQIRHLFFRAICDDFTDYSARRKVFLPRK